MESTLSSEAGPRPGLIIVDDDPIILESLGAAFDDRFEVFRARNRREARSAVRQMGAPPDYAIVDLGLPPSRHKPEQGFAVIKDILATSPECALVVVSGQENEQNARLARTLGAADFIGKPSDPERILEALQVAKRAQAEEDDRYGFVGESRPLRLLCERIRALAGGPYPLLIEGETGSGKELAARAVHNIGRPGRPFLALNCAAIPSQLFEATLFGHRRGAFTGAASDNDGYFGDAGDGTLFLDEIGELSPDLQPKLLRTLETGEYQRVGETSPRAASARVIAATNRDLANDVRAGQFRTDLFHRLSVLTLSVPPLREMGADLALLLEHFSADVAGRLATPRFRLSGEALRLLEGYRFPGNVRELRNIVIRLQSRHPGAEVSGGQLRDELCVAGEVAGDAGGLLEFSGIRGQVGAAIRERGSLDIGDAVRGFRRACAEAALAESGGDRARAARALRTDPATLGGIVGPDGE